MFECDGGTDNEKFIHVWNFLTAKKHLKVASMLQLPMEAKKNSEFQRGLNPWPRDTSAKLQPTELWIKWRWDLVIYGF